MCGICGFTGKSDYNVLKKMTDSIFHRGPDEEGLFADDFVNLGVRRLSILDLSSGHQPVHNEDSKIWVVFNGEIYNFAEIRKDLIGKGHKFYTDHSDTETIVHLYEEYGLEFPNHLNGMFAIALYDKKDSKLYLIRDRMGVKPLFYSVIRGNLVFGSEIKAILQYPECKREINYEAIYYYFSFKNVPAPLTAFKNIYSLLPGEMLTFCCNNIIPTKWWTIRFNELDRCDEEFVKKNILDILEDATKVRMICDVPIGAYLSGGVDSSTIVAIMSKYSDFPIKTFTLGYEDELKNKEADLYHARRVSKMFKTEHHEYIMTASELKNDIENVICSFDQPFSGTISTYFLSKLIKQHVKVALSGDGADELFGSYLTHRVSQPMFHLNRLYEKVVNNTLSVKEMSYFKPCDLKFLLDLYKKSNGNEIIWRYSLCLFKDDEKDDILSDYFKLKINGLSTLSKMASDFQKVTSHDPLNRILEMEWNTIFPDQVLAFVDFLSMAHSVEVRSPFLDYRLVEFVSSIPGNLKIKNGIVKDILKKSVKTIIPEGIIDRPKEGFVLPIFDWMVDKFKDYSYEMLSETRLSKHGFFKAEAVKYLLNQYHNGDRTLAGKIWNLMMFQVWWEKYFNN